MSSRSTRLLLPVIYLGFISLGLPDGAMGAAWTQMHQTLSLPVGLAGPLMLLGTMIGAASSLASARIIGRFSTGPVVFVSCLITGVGMLLISQAPHVGWLWVAAGLLGLGAGAVDAGLNGYVARHYEGRHMSWLHACWGIGATGGPFLIATAMATTVGGWRTGYLTIAVIQLGLAGLFLATLHLWRRNPERAMNAAGEKEEIDASKQPQARANSPAGWLSAALFMIYVGAEMTAGLWLATFLVMERGASPAVAGLCATVYYGSITGARVLNGFVVDHWGNRKVISRGLWLALIGAVGFAVATPIWLAGFSLVLVGIGIAAVYPGLMHEVPKRFVPEDVQTVISRQNSAAYIGGAVVPVAAGYMVQEITVVVVPMMLIGGILALKFGVNRLDRLTP